MELEAGRCRVTLVEMTNASERARTAANLMTQSDNPLPHAVQGSTPARFADRQLSISSPRRQPLPVALALLLAPSALPLFDAARRAAAALRSLPPPAQSPARLTLTASLCCSLSLLHP